MVTNIVCAVDDSPTAEGAGLWAARNLARPGDTLHFISTAPPPSYTMMPVPIASSGAVSSQLQLGPSCMLPLVPLTANCCLHLQVAALSINWEQQRKADEEQCRQLLVQVVDAAYCALARPCTDHDCDAPPLCSPRCAAGSSAPRVCP